jgi:small subunit ribosomal protein S24e
LELKVLEERKNPLLRRTEYRFEVSHPNGATPTRDTVRQALANAAHVPKERVVIERIQARFGTARSTGAGAAYETKEALEVTVREHIQVRNGLKEKKAAKAPGAAAESVAPEAPAAPPVAEKKATKAPGAASDSPAPGAPAAPPPAEKK